MRFHLVNFPHTQVTTEYSSSAFTDKLRKFVHMMGARGHQTLLYAGDVTDAPCDELITCVTEHERAEFAGESHYTDLSWDSSLPIWQKFNSTAIAEIRKRARPGDFVCLSCGFAQREIAAALPDLMVVEYCVGYGGSFAQYRVFESYAWMHTTYGRENGGNAVPGAGHWYDAVIPSYLDATQFEFRQKKDDYYLFIGRVIESKGYQIAVDVCRAIGKNLIIAGPGNAPAGTNHVGEVGPVVRSYLMSRATAIFAPTLFVEPFGNVAIEAMACGTPVIATDWGGFTETVQQGVTGYRCRTFAEFIEAAERVRGLSPRRIRNHALRNHSLEVVGEKYEKYFRRLEGTRDGGWYHRPEKPS